KAALVGRDAERRRLVELLVGDARRVSVVGPGGMGKTTLALEAGRELVERFADGAWFVDLSAIDDLGQLDKAIATTLGATEELITHLAGRNALLVLDNFEQIIDAAGSVGELLERCPAVACL